MSNPHLVTDWLESKGHGINKILYLILLLQNCVTKTSLMLQMI